MADGELAAMEGGGERKRKRGTESSSSSSSQSAAAEAKWRTEGEQRTYSSRLIAALRRVRSSAPAATDRAQSRALREAADRALAVSARGRTRWSRAILLSGKVRSLKRSRVLLRPRAPTRPKPNTAAAGSSRPPALEKKTRVLGRLVPGCRKLPLPSLLEEVSDYIAALQMQVRAMNAIAEVLSVASAAPSPPPPPPPPPPQPM